MKTESEIKLKPQIVGMTRRADGNNLAEFDVQYGAAKIRSGRLAYRRQGYILTFPSQRIEDDGGTTIYHPYVELAPELLQEVREAAIKAYNEMAEFELR